MIDRCWQTHQSGTAGGGDGRRRDDQDHLGVHQGEGDRGGGVNTQTLVWVSVAEAPMLSDSPIFTSQTDTWMWGKGYVEDYVCMMWGEGPLFCFIQSLADCPRREQMASWLRKKTWKSMRLKVPEWFLTTDEFCCCLQILKTHRLQCKWDLFGWFLRFLIFMFLTFLELLLQFSCLVLTIPVIPEWIHFGKFYLWYGLLKRNK